MRSVNRYAIVVTPKPPMMTWVNFHDSGDPVSMGDMTEEPSIYLVPEYANLADAHQYVAKNFDRIFVEQLAAWCVDEETWPEGRTLEMFTVWFSYSLHSIVIDLVSGPLKRESL